MFIIILVVSWMSLAAEVELKVAARPKDVRRISGTAEFDSQEFQTSCICEETNTQLHVGESHCDPTKVKLHQDFAGDDGSTATFEQIRYLIGPLSELKFADPRSYHFSCLDGRNEEGILGTPGGDAGEFILALQVYEQQTAANLTQDAVDAILTNYLNHMSAAKFYMCTDDDAINHLEKELGMTLTIDALINPAESFKNDLMTALLKAENVGCLHIKSIMKNPESYDIRLDLVRYFMRSFFTILWNKSNVIHHKLLFEIMAGRHAEQAFLEIRTNEACLRQFVSPLIVPKRRISMPSVAQGPTAQTFHDPNATQVFQAYVNHLDAVSTRRRDLAIFFANSVVHEGLHIEVDVMHHRMNKKGLMYLELTGQKIARYLAFYTVTLV